MTAIGIFLCDGHHLGTHGIEMDVADEPGKVAFALAEYRFMPSLKYMPNTSIPSVIILTVTGQNPLHHASNRFGLAFDQQVNMIGHKAIGVKVKRGPLFALQAARGTLDGLLRNEKYPAGRYPA